MAKWLLLLLLVSCGKSSPPPKTVEGVYAEAVQLYGEPEQVEKVYQPQCEYTIWYCWYWTQGFGYNITKLRNESAEVSYFQTFEPHLPGANG